MSATTTGTGLKRLQHLVLWVSSVERSVRFYCDVVGFEVKRRYPNAAFLTIPGNLDLFPIDLDAQSRDNLSTQVWPTPQRRSLVRTT